MFQFTIRELLMLTVIGAMSVGWWLDHQRNVGAAGDARFLANVAEHGCHCQMVPQYIALRDKYGIETAWRLDDTQWERLSALNKKQNKSN
jgi:hypothetical protein